MSRKVADIDLSGLENRSILIIDDNNSVHRDYQAVLRPISNEQEENELDRLEAFLLGDKPQTKSAPQSRNFQLQSALKGEEAFELVKKHLAKGIRYPLAFVDMRMPPGWDGLETIQNLRDLDSEMRYVIVTAYSDYSEEELKQRVGEQNLIEVVHKPFNPNEIYTLAYKTVAEWNGLQLG